jgi:hypothetical protein
MRDRNSTTANPRSGASVQSGRFLGFVQVHVGSRSVALPVQAVHFASNGDAIDADVDRVAGGLFEEGGQLAILVDDDASDADVQAQILKASEEAVRQLSKR